MRPLLRLLALRAGRSADDATVRAFEVARWFGGTEGEAEGTLTIVGSR